MVPCTPSVYLLLFLLSHLLEALTAFVQNGQEQLLGRLPVQQRRAAQLKLELIDDTVRLQGEDDCNADRFPPDRDSYSNGPQPNEYNRKDSNDQFVWLEHGTHAFFDLELYPLGTLTQEDVETMSGFMAAWARRRSVKSALTVERLLKRLVDDIRVQMSCRNSNPGGVVVQVNTRLYTHVRYFCLVWLATHTPQSSWVPFFSYLFVYSNTLFGLYTVDIGNRCVGQERSRRVGSTGTDHP
jgi:hypothetical protein